MRLWQDTLDSFKALTVAFLARFFESEITSSTDDVKGPFFWLLAALAVPGIFIPWMMVFDWHMIGMFKGAVALREASQAEKVFYLGFAMVASGLLTTIAWSSLLPDRRDTLILGTLPVSAATIVAAKLAALAAYVLLVAVAMHALAAVFFGSILATNSGSLFALRGILAHFIASTAASAAVALVVAAAQGLTLAVAGPRIFRRVTTILQVCLVGLIALGLATLPTITSSVVHTVRGFGLNREPWILFTPPVWFLGMYEWVLGTSDPVLLGLARNAALTLLAAAAVVVAAYPIAYRRLMVSVVELGSGPGRSALARRVRALVVGAAGRHPEARAAGDFFMATIARVERHRFVLAIGLGVAIAWELPGWKSFEASLEPRPALLSLPLSSMMFVIAGLRIAASLPGDVRAGWLFDVMHPSRAYARQALERLMFLLGVVPAVILSAPLYWWLWGSTVALIHATISLALGAVLVELLIWHCQGMPCGQRWNPVRANLGRRWPLYLAVFLIVSVGIPRLEIVLFANFSFAAAYVALLIVVAVATRYASGRHQIVPIYDDIDPVAGVLRLN